MKRDDKLLKELAEEKKRNFKSNLEFVVLHAEWLKRTSNRSWSRQQKQIIDGVYSANRKLRIEK